jgi:hypothetical protein
MIKRTWTAEEADEWTREDWITIVLSPLIYTILTIGVALMCMLRLDGFILTAIGIVLTIVMHWIIDPKLKAISEEYEKKQQAYLEDLEDAARWKQDF